MTQNKKYFFLTLLATILFSNLSLADENDFALAKSFYGRLEFFSSGASLTDATGLKNGANCLLDEATLTIPAFPTSGKPQLVAAYLYWAGTLFSDDNDDLFVTTDLECHDYINNIDNCSVENDDYHDLILEAARKSVDQTVSLTLPGKNTPIGITAPAENIALFGQYKSAEPEKGNVVYFQAKVDITDLLNKELTTFSGNYKLSGLTADICNGQEARCSKGQTCGGESKNHSNATASFSIVLVLEDPEWRLRRVYLYDGLKGLSSEKTSIVIKDIVVSDPPSGKLSFYALEGDSEIPSQDDEWVTVNGGKETIKLIDSLNPEGNIYNGTINSANITGIAGVDIDEFDISDSLKADAKKLDITFSTGPDAIVLGALNVSIGVFSPVLEYDSSLALFETEPPVKALSEISYLVTLSNTGNLTGHADFTLALPEEIERWEIEQLPDGVTNNSSLNGGNGRGIIDIKGITVDAENVAQLRFKLVPGCRARLKPLQLVAQVNYEGGQFTLKSSSVEVINDETGSCGVLEPDPKPGDDTPFWVKYGLKLEGGGGCNGLGTSVFWPLLFLIPALFRRRND